jgi:hypothetical protein
MKSIFYFSRREEKRREEKRREEKASITHFSSMPSIAIL